MENAMNLEVGKGIIQSVLTRLEVANAKEIEED